MRSSRNCSRSRGVRESIQRMSVTSTPSSLNSERGASSMALGSRSVTATAYRFEEPSPGLRVHQSGNCAVAAQVSNSSNSSLDVYRLPIYNKLVIRSFRDEGTEKIFHQQPSKRFRAIEKTALRKLFQLQRALSLRDLAAIPGNQLEALKRQPERAVQHSHQRSVPNLLPMGRGRSLRRGNYRLPLGVPTLCLH